MDGIVQLFSTPVYITTWNNHDSLTSNLLKILEVELNNVASINENVKGQEVSDYFRLGRTVKSETADTLHINYPELKPFFLWCLEVFHRFLDELGIALNCIPQIKNCWGNSYKEGDYHQTHNHPMCAFSGVYCVDTPLATPPQAALDFHDPRPHINYYSPKINLFKEDTIGLMLKAGDFVIFPGWLRHFVNPFRGRGARHTLSMNFDFV